MDRRADIRKRRVVPRAAPRIPEFIRLEYVISDDEPFIVKGISSSSRIIPNTGDLVTLFNDKNEQNFYKVIERIFFFRSKSINAVRLVLEPIQDMDDNNSFVPNEDDDRSALLDKIRALEDVIIEMGRT